MASEQRSHRHPSLRVTIKHDTDDRAVFDNPSTSRTRRCKDNARPTHFHPRTVYYNSNHRNQYATRSSTSSLCRSTPSDRQPSVQPLMELRDNQSPVCYTHSTAYPAGQQRQPRQRGQYRNRKAELDWDHAFDLDLIDLYARQHDSDNHSLASITSSSDQSFTSV